MGTITERVDPAKHPHADQLAEEVSFMAARLIEARELIGDAPLVIEYDNGGGQRGTRKNPAYEAYAQLFNTFIRGMAALDAVLAEAEPESEEGRVSLDSLRVLVNDRLKAAR